MDPHLLTHLVGTQVIIREATTFREATIIRETIFLEVHVYIKDNYSIVKLQFALPQTIFKYIFPYNRSLV